MSVPVNHWRVILTFALLIQLFLIAPSLSTFVEQLSNFGSGGNISSVIIPIWSIIHFLLILSAIILLFKHRPNATFSTLLYADAVVFLGMMVSYHDWLAGGQIALLGALLILGFAVSMVLAARVISGKKMWLTE